MLHSEVYAACCMHFLLATPWLLLLANFGKWRNWPQVAQYLSSSSLLSFPPRRPAQRDIGAAPRRRRTTNFSASSTSSTSTSAKLVAPQAICQGHWCAAGLWWAWPNWLWQSIVKLLPDKETQIETEIETHKVLSQGGRGGCWGHSNRVWLLNNGKSKFMVNN